MGDGPEKVRGGGGIVFGGGLASETLELGAEGRLDLPAGKGTVSVMVGATWAGIFGKRQPQSPTTRTLTPGEVSHYKANGLIKGNITNNNGGTSTEGEEHREPIVSVFVNIQGTGKLSNSWRMGGFWSPGALVVDETSGKISGDVSFQQPTKAPCVDLPGQHRCEDINNTPAPTVAIAHDPTTKRRALFTNHLGLVVEADAGDNVTFAARIGLQLATNPGVATEANFGGFVAVDFHTSGRKEEVSPATAKVDPQGSQHHVEVGGTARYTFETNRAGKLKYVIKDAEGTAVTEEDSKDVHEGSNDVDILAKNKTNPLPPGQYFVKFTFEPEKGEVKWHADGYIKSLVVKAQTPPITAAHLPTRKLEKDVVVVDTENIVLNVASDRDEKATIHWQVLDASGNPLSSPVEGDLDVTKNQGKIPLTGTKGLAIGNYQIAMWDQSDPAKKPIDPSLTFSVNPAVSLAIDPINLAKIQRPAGFTAGSKIRVMVIPSHNTRVNITVHDSKGKQFTNAKGSIALENAAASATTTFIITLPTRTDGLIKGKNPLEIRVSSEGGTSTIKIPIIVKVVGGGSGTRGGRPITTRGK